MFGGEAGTKLLCFGSHAVKGIEVYLKCSFYLEMALGTSHPIEPYFLPFKLGMKAGEGVGFVYFLTLLTHQLLCLRNNHNVNLKYSGIRKHWGFTCPSEGVSVVSKVNGLCFPRVVILNHIYDCLCY